VPTGCGERLAAEFEAILTARIPLVEGWFERGYQTTAQSLLLGLCTAEHLLSDAQEFARQGNTELLYSDEFLHLADAFCIPL
jgi:hypothetical protein